MQIPNFETSIFTTTSQLALQHNAINLGQGFPEFPMPLGLIEEVNKAMIEGHNQYAPASGASSLRIAIAEKIQFLHQQTLNPDHQILITPGGSYALFISLMSLINKGDEVIILEPAFDIYKPLIQLPEGIPIPIELNFPNFDVPWDEVKAKITSKTKAIIINTPHNPSGKLLKESDFEQLIEIVNHHNIKIISDEVYEHICFDGFKHRSILDYPALMSHSIVCFSFGKSFSCTGWKIGYCISSESIIKDLKKLHHNIVFCVDHPKQIALAHYLKEPNNYLQLSATLQVKRDLLRTLLKDSNYTLYPAHGTYFECYGFEKISNLSDTEFSQKLITNHKIATIPLSYFYSKKTDHKIVRICFAKNDDTLVESAQRLKSYV
ncbi:MAG: methionine aminotransferase [Alphaproteobacteria bacterium]|nr:methionine aminotransferase [Alphaproteobacteria bacterium]